MRRLHPRDSSSKFSRLGSFPYNQDGDDEGTPAPEWVALRAKIKAADAVLFVTPEYNRSVPGVLKNAIDVASLPYGHSAWDEKPGAVVSVSPGAIGAFGANHHQCQSFVFLNVPMILQPEAYIGGAATLFDKEGGVTNEGTQKFLKTFMEAFARWTEAFMAG